MADKKNYICKIPFNQIQMFDNQNYLCCPSWLTEPIGDNGNIKETFYSKKSEDIRNSILDGTYKYCNEINCPNLSGLKKNIIPEDFIHKSNESIEYIKNNTFPKHLNFNFDKSCNFKCPSCRTDYINFLGDDRKIVENKLKQINEELSNDIEKIYISGSADAFYSNSFRKFLINLNPKKYPKLKNIHLHTNASLWDKELWNKMKNIHKYVKTCEISIDAADKDTYENKVRLGGNWDVLQENLKFITKIKTIKHYSFSFVVQDTNYMEMFDFYKMVESHFENRTDVGWGCFYAVLVNWNTFNQAEFLIKDVCNPNHPEHKLFLMELDKVNRLPNFNSNLNHLYNLKKTLI
jgi:hypothetical protein